jgi:hypothetical protein
MLNDSSLTGLTTAERGEAIFQKIVERINQPALVRKIYNWKRWAAAASILLIISLSSYFLFFNKNTNPQIANQPTKDVQAPSSNRAMITLANGQVVYLDSVANGTLATTGTVTVTKNSTGEIVYNGTATAVEYNTMFNPRGSKVQPLTLSDGTKVWLNSESSIKYPTAFTGNERRVEITGEAYFSVTHNDKQPFKVNANGTIIEDLGTEFNVNAYTDETSVKTTLINGIVRIGTIQLKPGQQAINDKLNNEVVDVQQILAWKTGFYEYDNYNVTVIMRQLARWYDVSIEYKSATPNV